ncbi:universal stress protein [Umezawaea sp. Da 62-37]|uniref:universal stress protein n=1 Tax=Umezawaea sp. Da 62-37 TaxID=3075927 RepID=UPI0028F747A1|nr:universal stress protein [Umezawaea sp. Da 62-37]WNV84795.1 universal stress protein [Umezawaea sp. Da 62-37]WNV87452.1 universal stress protein [Umezawaea sp. Da 62-37]
MDLPLIVVGVDGSPASRTALRWALNEAKRSGAAVEATMAWQHESEFVPAVSLGVHPYAEVLPQQHHHPARVLHDLVTEIRAELPDAPEIAEVTITGDASTALLRASRQAALLVVGRHAHGPLTEALLGSVTTDCIRHAACPVVVIPPGVTTRSADAVRVAAR